MLEELLALLNKPEEINSDDILAFKNVNYEKRPDGSFKVIKNPVTFRTEIVLKKGDVANLTEDMITTTVGRALANRILKIDPFGTYFPYDNSPTKINDFVNSATIHLMNNKITTDQMIKLFNNAIWLTRFADMILPSLSRNILTTPKSSVSLRNKLTKENQQFIDAGNAAQYEKNVKEPVLADIVNNLKDDPSFELYLMGKPSVGNHLKQTIGTFSPLPDPATGKFVIPTGCYQEGLHPEDYDVWANMNVTGTFGRAVATQNGGSVVKSLYGSMNNIIAGPAGSDCGTKKYKSVKLSKDSKLFYMWNYIVESGGRLVLLTPDNFDSYVGKNVDFRSPLYCMHENANIICNKCAGELPYKTGLLTIGSLTAKVGFNFVQLSMKGFHDTSIKLADLNIFDYMTVV